MDQARVNTLKLFATDTMVGVIVGINAIAFCLAYGALFTSISTKYVFYFSGFYLLGSVIAMLFSSLFSSLPIAIAAPQNHASAILLVIAITVAKFHSDQSSQLFPTIFFAVALSTLITGLFYFCIGYFRKGNLIRFIPYPVICGFLAGVGGEMFIKAILAMSGHLTEFNFTNIVQNELAMIVVAIVFASVLVILQRHYKYLAAVPFIFLATIIIFYLILFITHTSMATAINNGWLNQPSGTSQLLKIPNLSQFAEINWHSFYSVINLILVVVLINIITLLINIVSVEVAIESNIDVNRELKVSGIANVLSSIGGGIAGYLVVSQTILAQTLGGKTRIVGVIAASCCLMGLIFGSTFILYIPKFVLFGMLIFIAANFLITWLYEAYYRLDLQDYIIVITIFFAILTFGFVPGVIFGTILSMLLFIIRYSKINIIKYKLTEETFHSKILRSLKLQKKLEMHGKELLYFKLQGYIFFGTTYTLLEKIRPYFNKPISPVHYMIFDFSEVSGVDSSSIRYFIKLKQLARQHSVILFFTNIFPTIAENMNREKLISIPDPKSNLISGKIYYFDLLDNALEWCEEDILKIASKGDEENLPFLEQLKNLDFSSEIAERLIKYFKKLEITSGEFITQGEKSKGLYFIEDGEVSVILRLANGNKVRLRKIGGENTIGEMGLYNREQVSASIVVERPCILQFLSHEALNKMEQEEPDLVVELQKFIIITLTERIIFQNSQIETLLK